MAFLEGSSAAIYTPQVALPILPLPPVVLPPDLERDLRRTNPWWSGKPVPPQPSTRRHLVRQIHLRLAKRLAPAVVVRGSRQVGKTTAMLQVITDLLAAGVLPTHIFYIQADELPALSAFLEPILRLADWYEETILGKTLNEAAHAGEKTYLFFDEIQNLKAWAPQIKFLVDHSATQAVITGSSALRIEQGRDSLAGRITTLEAGVLSLTEIASFRGLDLGPPFLPDNGLKALTEIDFWQRLRVHGKSPSVSSARDRAFSWFSERGGYPLAHQQTEGSWNELADMLNETVIKRVIQHDLRVGDRGRKRDAVLLEELFRLACRYVGQAPDRQVFVREIQRTLAANIQPLRIGQYLKFLGDTLLLRLVPALEIRLKKSVGGPKICLADHGLRASWLQEVVPLDPSELQREPHLSLLAGRIAESVTGATLATIPNLDLAHLPARVGEPEIDFILTVGTKRIPLEVKYQRRIDPLADTEGLRTFLEKSVNNAPLGLLITQSDLEGVPLDPRIVAMPLSTFMLLR